MQKRILSCLLAFFLTFGIGTDSTWAVQAVTETEDFAEITEQELMTEDDAGFHEERPTGLGHMIQVEIAPEDIPEVYEPSEEWEQRKGSAAYLSAWDAYSTNYYYNQLNDAQRKFWDKLDQMCHAYLTGTESLTSSDRYFNASSGSDFIYFRTKSVLYENLSQQAALETMQMFVFSNPQYYFLQALYSAVQAGNGGIAVLSVNDSFANGSVRMAETRKLQGIINSWMQQVNAQPTALLKEKKIHDMICEKITYDVNYNTFAQNKYNQTIYSVFCTDTTVCAGYSQAMMLLCNAAGIDCAVVTSKEHEWNIIRLNGTWYYVDCTWDDNIADRNGWKSAYFYFNRSHQTFMQDQNAANVRSHITESLWNGKLPDLIYDSGATDTDIGSIYTPAAALMAPQIVAAGDKVKITAPTGGNVYYTTDGTDPSIASTKSKKYTGEIALSGVTVVRAVASTTGYYDSGITGATITPQYKVTFNANGGYIGKKNVKSSVSTIIHGNAIGKIKNAKRKGYAFLGWYTAKTGGSKISTSSGVTASRTYYARWAKINPKKAQLSSVKNTSRRAMKIKIKKVNTASGFQLRYSTKQNMSGAKRKDISETSCTIKKLSKGKTYYVQVRMYQKESVSGKKSYGPWSKTKKVKVKK
ncbi:MAG: hypothetical protein HFJ05_05630 [Eubacterium sp.]|nr:hypothetical protein [Eubacterium sp.]